MSEEDRAAKAARAKALLKKRQQKKVADSAVAAASSGVASPVNPQRTFSPAPSEPVEKDQRDLGDVFSKDASDTSWLTSLPRVASPPPPAPPHVISTVRRVSASSPNGAPVSSEPPHHSSSNESSGLQKKLDSLSKENESLAATVSRLQKFETTAEQALASLEAERKRVEELEQSYQKLQDDTEIALQNEHQTVSLLVTEKAHLTSELQKRDDVESNVQALEDQLETEKIMSENLSQQVFRLETEVNDARQRAEQSDSKEKELAERHKEQERELQVTSASAAELRKEADEFRRKFRELEEQVQSDDRAERLESSLKNTQDRAAELEFQLTKLKQAHTALKSDRDTLEVELGETSTKEVDLKARIQELESQFSATRDELSAVKIERDLLSEEKVELQGSLDTHASRTKDHEEKLAQAASTVTSHARQIQNTQSELKNANRRADEAERAQKELQAEGSRLMQALEEMRPKIIELTSAKVDFAEKVGNLEHTVRNRDSVIAQLENDLGEAREQNDVTEKVWKERLSEQEKRQKDIENGTSTIQTAYAELQEELDTTLASLRNLELQRTNQHQEASRRLEEIERLTSQSQTYEEELGTLRNELEARRKAHDEEQDFLERAQNEIEALRAEISSRDAEIEHLRETVKSPAWSDAPRSLDDEMLSSIRQQHAIDLSSAVSQIRELENTIFDKDSLNHALQKQVNALEEQMSQLRPNSRLGQVSRPSSRNDMRRPSAPSHRSSNNTSAPLSRTIFDHVMTQETMHKRKVSLSMLQARIASEIRPTSAPPSRALSPVHSEGGQSHSHKSPVALAPHLHRPQFLDESHVFWCNSCHGDLVIL